MNRTKDRWMNRIFYIIMILNVAATFLYLFHTSDAAWTKLIIWDGEGWYHDFFQDIVRTKTRHAYTNGWSESPLALVFFYLIRRIIPYNVVDQGVEALMGDQTTLILLTIYISAILAGIGIGTAKLLQNEGGQALLTTVVIVFSAPVLNMLYKGNVVGVAVLFLMAALMLEQYEERLLRELSCLLMAIAIGLWLPAVFFLIIYIAGKNYAGLVKTAGLAGIMTILPLLFFGGKNGLTIGWHNYLRELNQALETAPQHLMSVRTIIIAIILLLLALAALYKNQEQWKLLAIAGTLAILLPPISYIYNIIVMIPALLFFLKTDKKMNLWNWLYMFLFAGIFVTLGTTVAKYCLIAMLILFVVELVAELIVKRAHTK